MTESNQTFALLAAKNRVRRKISSVFGWIFVAFTVCGLIGMIVCLILLGLGRADEKLLTILCASLLGGMAVFGLSAFGLIRLSSKFDKRETDCLERADGEFSFFVGEGTLATFGESALSIRGVAAGGKREKTVTVPYTDMRFFSVCTRRAPKEKGEWIVVMEIPVKYLAKDGKARRNDPPALIQTDAKPRLYEALKARNLSLMGELPTDGVAKKFERMRTFVLPDVKKRKKSLLIAALGAVLLAGGAAVIFWNATLGSVIAVAGAYLAVHGVLNYTRAKSSLVVYREGLYWKNHMQFDNTFLKWDEIVRLSSFEREGGFMKAECLYGAYEFPDVNGAYRYIGETFPEKCAKE